MWYAAPATLDDAILAVLARHADTALTVREIGIELTVWTSPDTIRRHVGHLRDKGQVARLGVAAGGARCWGITQRGLDRHRARTVLPPVG